MRPILRRFVVLGTPLTMGILTITHPVFFVQAGIIHGILPVVDWWTTLHILLLPLFCLIGLAAYLLSDGIQGATATISRVAIGIFVVFYPIIDSLLGIGTGILVRYAGFLSSQQVVLEKSLVAIWYSPIVGLVGRLGALGWVVGVLTAAIALSRPSKSRLLVSILAFLAILFGVWSQLVFVELPFWIGTLVISIVLGFAARPHLPVGLLVLASFLFGVSHAPPFGPLGMACFFLAALQLELFRRKSTSATSELVSTASIAPGTN